jgi:alcohol dehydrogenase
MKAIRLDRPGEPLRVTDCLTPPLRSASVRVRVTRAPVLSFMHAVVSGELGYRIPTPCIPGANAIGVIEALADDVFGFGRGEPVLIDPSLKRGSETALLGLTAVSAGAASLQALYRDGTFAEQVVVPAENLTSLREAQNADEDRLACLSYLAIPLGGLLRGELRPGETVIVNGATGNLGSAGVLLSLAMGARRVVAVGRERVVLDELSCLDPRVAIVTLEGHREHDTRSIVAACEGEADLALDLLGSAPTADPTMACIGALRRGGTAVLMGSVNADLPVGYLALMQRELNLRGCFMYPREAPGQLVRMVASGVLDLSPIQTRSFALEHVDEALAAASRSPGLRYCLLVP